MSFSPGFITLTDICRAYRKAKREAFGDTNCAQGPKYTAFERNLEDNLCLVLAKLNAKNPSWSRDRNIIGRATCIAKAVAPASQDEGSHFALTDPFDDWKRRHRNLKADADFRVVIDATVEFQIISALWLMKVGHEFDALLDPRIARGNRLRRWRPKNGIMDGSVGQINEQCHTLFPPYYAAFGSWREDGLKTIKAELSEARHIVAVTMDLRRFYHQVDPSFLLHPIYLQTNRLNLDSDQKSFTRDIIEAIRSWNSLASKLTGKKEFGLPVGLTASGVIANVLLSEFDSAVQAIRPSYYGRYVDDIFLVLRHSGFSDGRGLMRWLAEKLGPIASYAERDSMPVLKLNLQYGGKSELLFTGEKQKVFQLKGQHGVDLISPIEEQIRRQKSEHRAMPELPDGEEGMAAQALLVSSDATLEADALRKADAVTLRRAGFAMLLSTVEQHARYVESKSWREVRKHFYGLASRHLLTPMGFFQFERYFPRVLGIMVACREPREAEAYLLQIRRLLQLLRKTCRFRESEFTACCQTLSDRMVEAVLSEPSVLDERTDVMSVLRAIKKTFSARMAIARRKSAIVARANRLFLTDWSRRSYGSTWLESRIRIDGQLRRPNMAEVGEFIQFQTLRRFRRAAQNRQPFHWPAFAFSTRPISVAEVTAYAPSLVRSYSELSAVIRALRGTWTARESTLTVTEATADGPETIRIPADSDNKALITVTNLLTSEQAWKAAVQRKPALSLRRYRRLNGLVNLILRQRPKPAYVLLPECSLPRRWARAIANKLYLNGASLIAGLEYSHGKTGIRNEALVSLSSNFPGYKTNLVFLQPKLAPAWEEAGSLKELSGKPFAKPENDAFKLPVYIHGGFCFAVLICSDLTTLVNRHVLQGCIDCLFVPEWNRDLETFASLIEATTNDLHAYVVQANNRLYGDSRIRAPYKQSFRRDVVRVRGGLHDYFVTDKIDVAGLREFQAHPKPPDSDDALFKPFPIGYKVSQARGG